MMAIENLLGLLVGVFVLIGVLFLCRELFCWYWKINRIIDIIADMGPGINRIWKKLEETNQLLKQLTETEFSHLRQQGESSGPTPRNAVCPYCKKVTWIDDSTSGSLQTCKHCQETFEVQ